MFKIYLVYETDCWHSKESKVLIGAGLNSHEAINICNDNNIKQYDKPITEKQKYDLFENLQTKLDDNDVNYIIDEHPVNTLIN